MQGQAKLLASLASQFGVLPWVHCGDDSGNHGTLFQGLLVGQVVVGIWSNQGSEKQVKFKPDKPTLGTNPIPSAMLFIKATAREIGLTLETVLDGSAIDKLLEDTIQRGHKEVE